MPLECGRTLSHAILTVSTAISGGSLTEYISSLQGIYSAARIAAFLQPVSQDFTLPSPTPNGISLSAAARAALLAQTGAENLEDAFLALAGGERKEASHA